ncbi:MAG: sugar phosphate isomerase/epimerase [Armatimonadetes bacterium]|nr:sugar phosphate isomerase/epimerase [Armatimonadota bacterium]
MSTARISIMVSAFHRSLSDGSLAPAKLVNDLRAAGITALEPALSWGENEPRRWAEVRAAAGDAGMVYSCGDAGVNLVGEGDSDRQRALDAVAHYVEAAAALACPAILVVGSRPAPGMSHEEGRRVMAETLARAAARAEGSGVTLTIEDFGVTPAFVCSGAHVREVVEATGRPDVKVTFDNGNFLLADDEPAAAYVLLKERIVHVHIKDFAPAGGARLRSLAGEAHVGCTVGAGRAQVRECLALLKADGYSGWLSLEVGVAPALAEAVRAAGVVARMWDGA